MLNSRSEFNRCFIPRLRLVEEEEIKEREQMEIEEEEEVHGELLDREEQWARTKNIKRSKEQSHKWKPGSKGGKRPASRELRMVGDQVKRRDLRYWRKGGVRLKTKQRRLMEEQGRI